MKKALIIGPTLLDIIINSEELTSSDSSKSTNISVGGKGFNVAHTFTLFEVPTILATMYGKDKIGSTIQATLKKDGIELPDTNQTSDRSGIYVGIINEGGEVVFDKADVGIYQDQPIPEVNLSEISFILTFSSSSQSIFNWLQEVKQAHPDIVIGLEMAGRKDVGNVLPHLKNFDFFISNRKEGLSLAGALNAENIEGLIKTLHDQGISMSIITSGSSSVFVGDDSAGVLEIKKFPVSKVSEKIGTTVGAGDSFTATFCTCYYFEKMNLDESITRAMQIASHVIQSKNPILKSLPKNFNI